VVGQNGVAVVSVRQDDHLGSDAAAEAPFVARCLHSHLCFCDCLAVRLVDGGVRGRLQQAQQRREAVRASAHEQQLIHRDRCVRGVACAAGWCAAGVVPGGVDALGVAAVAGLVCVTPAADTGAAATVNVVVMVGATACLVCGRG
jgi:hypothetical protein